MREMISLSMAGGKLNFRAAAVILRNGYLLVHRIQGDAFWTLPGGRVEFGEDSATAILREINEEMQIDAHSPKLMYLAESFYTFKDLKYHEIGHYYRVDGVEDFPFRDDNLNCWEIFDEGETLEFRWIKSDIESLSTANVFPLFLRKHVPTMTGKLLHIVEKEGERG